MSWLRDLLEMYARVFRQAAVLAWRNIAMGLVVLIYPVLLVFAGTLAAQLGIVGGLLFQLALAACVGSWLAIVEEVVRGRRPTLADVPASFATYLGDVVTVFFLLWLLQLVAQIVLPPGSFLPILLVLAIFVFFNAVPELIYLGHHGSTELLAESYRFIAENWIEWFPASIALVLGFVMIDDVVPGGPYGMLHAVAIAVWLYYGSIVRGLLFLELSTSTRRSREFRRRTAG
jgi:hypothetical protein